MHSRFSPRCSLPPPPPPFTKCFPIKSRLLSLRLWLAVRFVLCSFCCNKLFINEYLSFGSRWSCVCVFARCFLLVQNTTKKSTTTTIATVTVWRRLWVWVCVCVRCGPVWMRFFCVIDDGTKDHHQTRAKRITILYKLYGERQYRNHLHFASSTGPGCVLSALVRFHLLRLRPLF